MENLGGVLPATSEGMKHRRIRKVRGIGGGAMSQPYQGGAYLKTGGKGPEGIRKQTSTVLRENGLKFYVEGPVSVSLRVSGGSTGQACVVPEQ